MNYRQKFAVEPGSSVHLAKIDPAFSGKHGLHEQAEELIRAEIARIDRLQYLLYASDDKSLLVVLQGLDAAGKDGVIRHLFSGMNPQGVSVVSFKQPTWIEAEHDFLWRSHSHAPAKGEVVIFNRSHYEDVLVPRVHKLIPRSEISRRYKLINQFEELLSRNGTRILKFYLHISPEEQLERFRQRLEDEAHQWKISESDYLERKFWRHYMDAYEPMLERTSTRHAPWYVIPSNHKWLRNLAISRIIADSMDDLGLKIPPARVDLADIRRKYHEAEEDGSNFRISK